MELYEQILLKAFEREALDKLWPEMAKHAEAIVAQQCYQALEQIQAVITNDRLTDAECFMQIEQIIRIYEQLGSDGGDRHDFG